MAEGDDWTRLEVEAAVSSYREMLRRELMGEQFNKAAENRRLQALIGRSKGSVEFKHQNISAVLNNARLPYVEGYKPRGNYQGLLEEVVLQVIAEDPEVLMLAEQAVHRSDFQESEEHDPASCWVQAPKGEGGLYARAADSAPVRRVSTRDYLEIESRNQALGLAGEEFVLKLEHERLWRAGRKKLAERIDHVSKSRGDGLGYDVLSFEENGSERLIEVKTTQFGIMTPFFATRNEVSVSNAEAERYQVYRVFSYSKRTRVFTLPGSMKVTCNLEPVTYRAQPS